jgi:hypothetical protein
VYGELEFRGQFTQFIAKFVKKTTDRKGEQIQLLRTGRCENTSATSKAALSASRRAPLSDKNPELLRV